MVFELKYSFSKQVRARDGLSKPHERSIKRLEAGKLRRARMLNYSNKVDIKFQKNKFRKRTKSSGKREQTRPKTCLTTKKSLKAKTMSLETNQETGIPFVKVEFEKNSKIGDITINKKFKEEITNLVESQLIRRKNVPSLPRILVKLTVEKQDEPLFDEIKEKNSKRLENLNSLDKKNKFKRKQSTSNLRIRHKQVKSEGNHDEKIVICHQCGWASVLPTNWELRIQSKCEHCTEFLYCKQVREYRYEAKDLLDQNEKIDILKSKNEKRKENEFKCFKH